MRRRLHELRPKHDRNMARAESAVEWAGYFKRRDDPMKGWAYICEAIRVVSECGCPRDWWPQDVRDVVLDATN